MARLLALRLYKSNARLHQFLKVKLAGDAGNLDGPVFQHLRVKLAKDSDLLSVDHDAGLAARDKARVAGFLDLVLVVKVVKERRHFAGRAVEVGVGGRGDKAKSLAGARSCVLFGANVGDFSDFKNLVGENRVGALGFRAQKRRND